MKFVYLRKSCSLTLLSVFSKHELLQQNEVVIWRSKYSLSMMDKACKPDYLQVMKSV